LRRILQEQPDHKEANALMAKIREVEDKSEKKGRMFLSDKTALQVYRKANTGFHSGIFKQALEMGSGKQAGGRPISGPSRPRLKTRQRPGMLSRWPAGPTDGRLERGSGKKVDSSSGFRSE